MRQLTIGWRVITLRKFLRPPSRLLGQAKGKKAFTIRYYSVHSNFATLKLPTEVMQRNVCVSDFYIADGAVYIIYTALSDIDNRLAWADSVAYPWEGAMRRPECRDKRVVLHPCLFVFHKLNSDMNLLTSGARRRNIVVPKSNSSHNNMINRKLNTMGNKKKKYVRPLMEELGFESEVHLLVTSDRHVNQSVRFDSTLEEKSLDEADDV